MLAAVFAAFKSLRLARKFTLGVVLVMSLVVLALTTLIIGYQRKSLRAEVDGHEESVARNLARDAVGPLVFLDPLRLDELVRAVDQLPGCIWAAVVDRQRRIVAHTDRKRLGEVLASIPTSGRSLPSDARDEALLGRVREIVVPVTVGYEVVGTVMVGFSQDEREGLIEEDLKALKRYIVAVSSLILGLGVAGAFGLARVLTTPIQRLKDTMALVQEGDLTAQVELGTRERCSDLLGCEERDCPARDQGPCWAVTGTRCRGRIQGDAASKIVECKQCVVYRRACGDEIGELTNAFNEMVRRLGANVRRLEEASRDKARLERITALGEMSMTVAHEIKNPLNAIRGAASCLQDTVRDEGPREFLSIIEQETGRLDEIVTSFLRFSKPPPLRLQAADVNQVVKDTLRLVQQEAAEEGVELRAFLEERMPPILVDPQQLRQALLNVVVNALAATPAGGAVTVRTSVVESRVSISVADTGHGMSDDVVKDIFKPFFTTKTRGSGLGLACVERVVREHGGEVAVESEVGGGTEFRIALPLERSNG